MPVTINVYGTSLDLDVEDHFNIDDTNLDRELCRQGKLLAYYAELAANMEAQAKSKKLDLERLTAKSDLDIRATARNAGEKLTEGQIRAKITVRPDFQEASEAYIKAQRDADVVKNLWNSIYLKTGLLRSMRSRQDAEMYNGE